MVEGLGAQVLGCLLELPPRRDALDDFLVHDARKSHRGTPGPTSPRSDPVASVSRPPPGSRSRPKCPPGTEGYFPSRNRLVIVARGGTRSLPRNSRMSLRLRFATNSRRARSTSSRFVFASECRNASSTNSSSSTMFVRISIHLLMCIVWRINAILKTIGPKNRSQIQGTDSEGSGHLPPPVGSRSS